MNTPKVHGLPEISKIDAELIWEFKNKAVQLNTAAGEKLFTFHAVAEAAGVHPQTVYSTFDHGRRHFNERIFNLACTMLTDAIEQHNSRISRYNERLEEIAALEIMEFDNQQ